MKRALRWSLATLAGAGAGGVALSLYSRYVAAGVERLVPPDGRYLEVEGARLHYVDRGSGPTIVMIHGLGGQLRNFRYAMLDRLAETHRVILLDRPGSGYSTADEGTTPGIADQAAIVGRFIATLGLDRPLLVGHSLGGAVALALATQRPELIRGLALIAPFTQPQSVPVAFIGLAVIPPALRHVVAETVATPLGQLTTARTVAAVFAPEAAPADFATRGGGALSLRPAAIAAAAADLAAAGDEIAAIAASYPTLTVPTAILFGRGDAILSATLHGTRTAAAIPGARVELIDGGHMLPITQPDRTAAFVRDAAARYAGDSPAA